VLSYLAEHSGQLVSKDELFAAVWPGVVVSDSALVACIGELRRALGDTRRAPRSIETVHGRGYRFIAPVAERPLAPPAVLRQAQHERSSEPVTLSLSKGDRALELPTSPRLSYCPSSI
jgi:DNA-binding winged helix-turn-helix (wHTH) protein